MVLTCRYFIPKRAGDRIYKNKTVIGLVNDDEKAGRLLSVEHFVKWKLAEKETGFPRK